MVKEMVAALTGDRVTVAMDSQVQHKVLYVYTMLGGLLYMKYTIHLKSQRNSRCLSVWGDLDLLHSETIEKMFWMFCF